MSASSTTVRTYCESNSALTRPYERAAKLDRKGMGLLRLGLVAQDLCDVYLDDVVVDDIGRIRGEGRRQIFAAIGPGRAPRPAATAAARRWPAPPPRRS